MNYRYGSHTVFKIQCNQIKQELAEVVRSHPLCQRLLTLPGIGVINATAMYSAIGNASQFAHQR